MISSLVFLLLKGDFASVSFTYRPSKTLKSVSVAGSFNGWNKDANPLKLQPDGHTWYSKVEVPVGRSTYKFVEDGSRWVLDPNAPAEEDEGGNRNSVVDGFPDDFNRPAVVGDGLISESGLSHEQKPAYITVESGIATIRFRARKGDLTKVSLHIDDGSPLVPMRQELFDGPYVIYTASVPWKRRAALSYTFKVEDGSVVKWFGQKGLVGQASDPFVLRPDAFKAWAVPSWVEKTVIYQIFPDRFENGNRSNDPKDVQPWGAVPTWRNHFGGDLAGIQQQIDYLNRLGIGAIYLTPVFKSPSSHRYDTEDYLKIEPELGTNDEFASLTKNLKAKKIRTIMDFAFYDTAKSFWAFDDVQKKGAASAFKDWYFIKSFPVNTEGSPNYEAYNGLAFMPKLNVMNPATHNYVLSVFDYWLKKADGVDGLRLDVASRVDSELWKDLRERIKPSRPDVWILGEEWGDATKWLQGDQWDASMNYPFRSVCLRFFAQQSIGSSELASKLMGVYRTYPPEVARNEMNFLSTHDTPRFLTQCKGDLGLDHLAAALLFTWPGTPSIYYGDEIGMEGGADPLNRKCMQWDKATDSNPTLNYYKALIKTRNSSESLQSGEPLILDVNDAKQTFAFARISGRDATVVALNRSRVKQTISFRLPELAPLNAAAREGFIDSLSNRQFSAIGHDLSLELEPCSALILRPRSRPDLSATRKQFRVANSK